jgi:hypothetical protein
MTDTVLHNLCKGFGALLSRSKVREKCIGNLLASRWLFSPGFAIRVAIVCF